MQLFPNYASVRHFFSDISHNILSLPDALSSQITNHANPSLFLASYFVPSTTNDSVLTSRLLFQDANINCAHLLIWDAKFSVRLPFPSLISIVFLLQFMVFFSFFYLLLYFPVIFVTNVFSFFFFLQFFPTFFFPFLRISFFFFNYFSIHLAFLIFFFFSNYSFFFLLISLFFIFHSLTLFFIFNSFPFVIFFSTFSILFYFYAYVLLF